MDIIEFIEKLYDLKLSAYQKEYIRFVSDLPEGSVIAMGRYGPMILTKDGKRIYPNSKEGE